MVRFATAPWHFMRLGHRDIVEWLSRNTITYTPVRHLVYFQLPEHLEQYTEVTPELARRLAPFAREITRRTHALSWSVIGKVRQPLSVDELRVLAEHSIQITL